MGNQSPHPPLTEEKVALQKMAPFKHFLPLLTLALCAMAFSACRPVVRERTLPPSIRAVSIPMAFNRTAEIGFEERLTIAVQEEFDADGRLLQARRLRDADAIVRIFVTDWETMTFALDSDGFPTAQEYFVRAHIHILENIPGRPMIGPARVVDELFVFNADPRTTTFDPEPRNKEELARRMARTIVREVITGEFEEADPGRAPTRATGVRTPIDP